MLKAIVQGDLRKWQMVDLEIDNRHIAATFGTARVEYTAHPGQISRKYMMTIDGHDGCCDAFFHVDDIEVRK